MRTITKWFIGRGKYGGRILGKVGDRDICTTPVATAKQTDDGIEATTHSGSVYLLKRPRMTDEDVAEFLNQYQEG